MEIDRQIGARDVKTLEHARFAIQRQMLHRLAEGLSNDIDCVDVAATEDGNGALVYVHLLDGETLYAGIDFPETIDPDRFEGERYVAAFFAISRTIQ